MNFDTLLLSRAPLSFRGGIPKYCYSIFKYTKQPIISVSPEIDHSLNIKTSRISNNFTDKQEITFYSDKIFHTAALSFSYFSWLRANLSKFKTIHYQHPDPITALIVLLFIRRHQKLVLTWHAEIFNELRYFFLLIVDLFILNRADHIVVFTRSHINSSRILRFFKQKINVIPMGIERFVSVEKALKSQKRSVERISRTSPLVLCAIGRLVEYKGYEYLLASLKENLHVSKCFIVGSGPLYCQLNCLIKEYNLQNKVKIITDADEDTKYQVLLESDVLVLPSITQNEAFGIVQIEAMMCSKPIIVSDLGNGVNELSTHLFNSIHVKPRSSSSLANAYKLIATDSVLYARLSENSLASSFNFQAKDSVATLTKLSNEL